MDKFVQIEGNHLTWQGERVRLRGVALSNWLLIEHFMIGLPHVESKMRSMFGQILGAEHERAFFDTWRDHYIREPDIEYLRSLGVNFVRLPINYRHLESDLSPGEWDEHGLAALDRAIAWCRKHQILVMLDLHASPGGASSSWNEDNATSHAGLWTDRSAQERTAAIWRMLAERYRDEEWVFGFDLLNEPEAESPVSDLYPRLIASVREVNRHHILVLEPNRWASRQESLTSALFKDPQVMTSPHFYPQLNFAWGALCEYPGNAEGQWIDKDLLREKVLRSCAHPSVNRPVLVGEFGMTNTPKVPDFHYAIFTDVIQIFEELGYHWCLWGYKDLSAMSFVRPRAENRWSELVNQPGDEVERKFAATFAPKSNGPETLIARMLSLFSDLDPEVVKYAVRMARKEIEPLLLEHKVRRLMGLTPEEVGELPRVFDLEQCDIDERGLSLVRDSWAKNSLPGWNAVR